MSRWSGRESLTYLLSLLWAASATLQYLITAKFTHSEVALCTIKSVRCESAQTKYLSLTHMTNAWHSARRPVSLLELARIIAPPSTKRVCLCTVVRPKVASTYLKCTSCTSITWSGWRFSSNRACHRLFKVLAAVSFLLRPNSLNHL